MPTGKGSSANERACSFADLPVCVWTSRIPWLGYRLIFGAMTRKMRSSYIRKTMRSERSFLFSLLIVGGVRVEGVEI